MTPTTLTCTKRYADLPFAHRQPHHAGHCARIHGHSWAFEFTFSAKERDACGFVLDFGSLKWLRQWIEERFDHTLVLSADDPFLQTLQTQLGGLLLANVQVVPDCSSEGIASFLMHEITLLLREATRGRVTLSKVVVHEDSKNSATITL